MYEVEVEDIYISNQNNHDKNNQITDRTNDHHSNVVIYKQEYQRVYRNVWCIIIRSCAHYIDH